MRNRIKRYLRNCRNIVSRRRKAEKQKMRGLRKRSKGLCLCLQELLMNSNKHFRYSLQRCEQRHSNLQNLLYFYFSLLKIICRIPVLKYSFIKFKRKIKNQKIIYLSCKFCRDVPFPPLSQQLLFVHLFGFL